MVGDGGGHHVTARVGRTVVEVLAILVVVQLAFFGLLVAAQAVPDGPIVTHLQEAVDEGTYGPTGRPDNMGAESTSFDECVAVGTGLGRPDLNPFERAARMPRIGSCSTGPDDIAALARGDTPDNVTEYFRYWAGWTVISRPVLALWGIDALRRIAGALLVLAAGTFVAVVARRTTSTYALALALPMLLGSNVLATPSTSLNQAISLSAAFLSPILTMIAVPRGWRATLVATAVGAALYNYVDLMLTPAIPWMLATTTTIAVMLLRSERLQPAVQRALAVAIAWPCAFAVTWASRWAIAVVLVGWDEAVTAIRDKVEFRLGGSSASVRDEFGASTQVSLDYWLANISTARAVLVGAGVVTVGALVVAVRRHGASRLRVFALLAAPACFAPAWYELLRNHSQIHPGKAHMSLPVALGVVVGAAVFAATTLRSRQGTVVPAEASTDTLPPAPRVLQPGSGVLGWRAVVGVARRGARADDPPRPTTVRDVAPATRWWRC